MRSSVVAVLAVSLALSPACGNKLDTKKRYKSEASTDFNPHVASFKREVRKHHSKLVSKRIFITYVDELPGRAVGLCVPDQEQPAIFIKKSFFKNLDYDQQEQLMWHELGHCLLGKEHDASHLNNGYPTSIMYPVVFSPEEMLYYVNHKEYYENNLFNP